MRHHPVHASLYTCYYLPVNLHTLLLREHQMRQKVQKPVKEKRWLLKHNQTHHQYSSTWHGCLWLVLSICFWKVLRGHQSLIVPFKLLPVSGRLSVWCLFHAALWRGELPLPHAQYQHLSLGCRGHIWALVCLDLLGRLRVVRWGEGLLIVGRARYTGHGQVYVPSMFSGNSGGFQGWGRGGRKTSSTCRLQLQEDNKREGWRTGADDIIGNRVEGFESKQHEKERER